MIGKEKTLRFGLLIGKFRKFMIVSYLPVRDKQKPNQPFFYCRLPVSASLTSHDAQRSDFFCRYKYALKILCEISALAKGETAEVGRLLAGSKITSMLAA
nr:hypothetical protein [Tanacetum cinerariifolium]